jgi:hypothetical protein
VRIALYVAVTSVATLGLAAGGHAQPRAEAYLPTISIAEIMESMVMPAAQVLWDAVGVDVTLQGQIEKKPETEEEWAELRAAAITLAEAANVVAIPGRRAAPAGAVSEDPDSELAPEKIDALLAAQRPAWIAHSQVLHAAAMEALGAVDRRDLDAISEAGGTLDEACESCHLQFWYPPQPKK